MINKGLFKGALSINFSSASFAFLNYYHPFRYFEYISDNGFICIYKNYKEYKGYQEEYIDFN